MTNPNVSTATEKDSINEQLVDALIAIFGSHPDYRPFHPKGIVCEGTFAPAGRTAWLTRAQHLQDVSSPVTVRFSDFSGVPGVPDGDPTANPRGMAIRFHLPSGALVSQPEHRKSSSLSYALWLRAVPPRQRPRHSTLFWQPTLRPSCSQWRPSRYPPVSQLSHSMRSTPFALRTGNDAVLGVG